jgi:hypothetical protein
MSHPILRSRAAMGAIVLGAILVPASSLRAQLVLDPDFRTVHDTALHVHWLADANRAGSNTFGVSNVNPDGSMTRSTARNWEL